MKEFQKTRPQDNRGSRFAWSNPILIKELRSRMRGKRAFLLLTLYLSFLALLILLVYLFYASTENNILISNRRQVFSRSLYWITYGAQMITIAFVAPALTGGSISGERERQTFDLIRTSLLPAGNLVIGKFLTGVIFLLLLIFASLPIQSLSFLLGGVAAQEVFLGTIILVVTTITICAAGMLFSSFTSRSLLSTVLSYGFTTLNIFGFPLFLLILLGLLQSTSFSYIENLTITAQALLLSFGWLLVALNPIATTVASAAIYIEEQSLFNFGISLSNNTTVTLISPWIPYSIICLLLSMVLLWISIRRINRPEV